MRSNAFSWLINILFPPRCAICKTSGMILCDQCNGVIVNQCASPIRIPVLPFLSIALAAGPMKDELSQAIYALKYRNQKDLAPLLAPRLMPAWHSLGTLTRSALVVPVPLHKSRIREREYNQAELLARCIAPSDRFCLDALVRIRSTTSQIKTATRAERIVNMQCAFQVVRAGCIAGRDIILIDDVCTTGATLSSCAQVLMTARPRSISAIVLAHGSGRKN